MYKLSCKCKTKNKNVNLSHQYDEQQLHELPTGANSATKERIHAFDRRKYRREQ